MKKYSPLYPMIFGIIVFAVGLLAGQIGFSLLFGAVPIIISIIIMHSETDANDPKRKKYTKSPHKVQSSTTQHKVCCARCGVDLSLLKLWQRKNVDGKSYCDVCEKILRSEPKGKPVQEPQKQEAVEEEKRAVAVCSLCKKEVFADNLIIVNGESYCRECYNIGYNSSETEKKTSNAQLCQISFEISGVSGQNLNVRIIEIAERLIIGGFKFCSAGIGCNSGKEDEGSVPNEKEYKSYDAFKTESSVSTSEHSYAYALFIRNTLKVYLYTERESIILRWFDVTEKAFAKTRVFTEGIIEEVYYNKCTLKQIDNIKADLFESLLKGEK